MRTALTHRLSVMNHSGRISQRRKMALHAFKLNSTATAVALVPPEYLRPEINSLRKLHDKAFSKWEPHINLLYPFVEKGETLRAAIVILRQHLVDHQTQRLTINLDRVDSFMHRKNSTVFLRPSVQSEEALCSLRASLVTSLGCGEKEGTHDGTFRPHMTIGQAGLTGSQLERLSDKVKSLAPVAWEGYSLVVLERQSSGEMKLVEELLFGDETVANMTPLLGHDGYKDCFSFTGTEWVQEESISTKMIWDEAKPIEMAVATYNLMAENENSASSFSSRLPLIVEAIKSAVEFSPASLRVLCLQEANEDILSLLLSSPFIQRTYPYSSQSPSSSFVSSRNLLTLSSAPFRHMKIDFDEHHKDMLDTCLGEYAVRVLNVHLTSGLSDESVAVKKRQMEKVTKLAITEHKRHVIVAGDFNLTTASSTLQSALRRRMISPVTAELVKEVIGADMWEDSYLVCNKDDLSDAENAEGEQGATFDRMSNSLAAKSEFAAIDDGAQRYDRVLYPKGANVHAKQVKRFGFPDQYGLCGSDHYGVCATLRIEAHDPNCTTLPSTSANDRTGRIEVVEDSRDLFPLVESFLPKQADQEQRKDALALLFKTLSSNGSQQDLLLAPLGSYLMDTYFADSDVDVLVIGTVNPKVFFEYASAQLQELAASANDGNDFKGVHFVNSLVSIIELTVMDIKFDLQYCESPGLLEKYHKLEAPKLETFVFDHAPFSGTLPHSMRPLNTYRDTAYLFKTVPDLTSYRLAYRFIALYLKRRGLYSAKFGYLGGIHLSLMLNRVVKLIALASDSDVKVSPAAIVRTFFGYYATFNWGKDIVTDPNLNQKPTRSAKDAVFIQAIHTPTARPNVASSCTVLSAQTFTFEFALAASQLKKGNWEWCLRPKNEVVTEFLNAFGAFARIHIDVWDIDEIRPDKVREIVGGLESKMTRLLVALGRLPKLEARVWPARFCIPSPGSSLIIEKAEGYYLVGISAHEEDAKNKKILTNKIIAAVKEFETDVNRSGEFRDFSGNSCVAMDVVSRRKVLEMGLVFDERDWGS